jgi:hypothetical protein
MKLDDLEFIARDMKNEMPIQSSTTFKIPYKFNPFPKDLQTESDKVDNQYLNNHLAEIEEAKHCGLLSKSNLEFFLNQQRQYHTESGILNHDNFFKQNITEYHTPMDLFNVGLVGVAGNVFTGIPGQTLETASTYGSSSGFQGIIIAGLTTASGDIGDSYNSIGINVSSGFDNDWRGAIYDGDGANYAGSLLGESSQVAVGANGWNDISLPITELVSTEVYIANQTVSATMGVYYNNFTKKEYDSQSIGAFTDPLVGIKQASDTQNHSRIRYV